MKLLRVLLIGAGIVAVLLAITLALAFTSSVQTWAARRVIAGDPSLGITHLGRVSAGLQRIELSDVTISRPGLALTLPSATIDLPLIGAARGDIQLRRLVAKGWTLDLTAQRSAAAPTSSSPPRAENKPAEFEGIFKLLELPADVAVGAVDVDGTIIFPTKPGQPSGRSSVKITGGDLAAGREGRFTLVAEAALPEGFAPVNQLSTTSVLSLTMDTPRTFTRVGVTNNSHAIGPGVPQGARLVSESAASREGGGETYNVSIRSIASAGAEKTLMQLRASNASAQASMDGTWSFDVSDADVSPFALGQTLPKFILGASGTFKADRSFREVQLAGKTTLNTERLEVLHAGLTELGAVQVQTDFDVAQRASGIRINRFLLDVAAKSPVLSVKVLQAMEVLPTTGEIKVAAPEADLFSISVKGVPLAWARPFAPADLAVSGNDVRGDFVARADQGGFVVRSVSPLLLGNLTVAQAGKPLISALDLSVDLAGSHSPAGWQADVSEIAARSRNATLFTLAAKAGQSAGTDQPIKVTGRLKAELPAILAQPALSEFSVLTQGTADVEFAASVTSALQQISSKLSVSGLRARDGKNLPIVSSDLRADLHADGRIEANVPLVFDLAGRKSDLEIAATAKTAGEQMTVDAQVLSRELYVDDLKLFAALQPAQPAAAPAPTPKPAPGPTTPPAPDKKPIWDGVKGQVKVAMKKVVYAAGQPPVEVATSIKITPEVLTLESFNAAFPDGANARADAVVKFEAAAPEPYDVTANLAATNIDPQPFLAAGNPGKPATVEGKFDLTAKVAGRAPSLDRLADTANVDAQLASRGGKFHGFQTSALAAGAGKVQDTTSKVGSLLSIAGNVLGKSELARAGEKTRAYSDTVKRLANFNFDQLNIDVSHRAGAATTEIRNFSILSPDIRLLGDGSIDSKSGLKSILQSAMSLDLQMAVRGAQADDLRIIEVLKKESDELGYTSLVDRVTVKGTPSSMDFSSLFQQILAKIR